MLHNRIIDAGHLQHTHAHMAADFLKIIFKNINSHNFARKKNERQTRIEVDLSTFECRIFSTECTSNCRFEFILNTVQDDNNISIYLSLQFPIE